MEINTDKELITLLHNRIENIYDEQQIVPLRGFSSDGNDFPYKLPNGKQFIGWTFDIFNDIPNIQIINNNDDILFLSDEIVYFIALLYFYQPYIENYTDNPVINNGKPFYVAGQTIEGKRYDMFVDILFEKIYSFFDRLANLIVLFFPNKFPKNENIHFSNTICKLKSDYGTNDSFTWLLDFRDNEFRELNKQRRNAVHNISTVTKNFNTQRLNNYVDYEKTEELQKTRIQYADYFKQMHNLCIEGFEKTLSFLDYVKSNTNKQTKYTCN
jgi:hypothetical protein